MNNRPHDAPALRVALLDWYDASGRTLPWRIRPEDRASGVVANPYAVWLSEIMLQQTTVPHATPYWEKFLAEFPTVETLADAPRDRVLTLWAGLGYYARARNLHKCAQIIRDEHDGVFPGSEAALLKLPGIGPYTAAAIAAICYGEATNVVDGNVERVISRLRAVQTPLPPAKAEINALAGEIASPERPADYAQAIMDLGATICRPKNPDCEACPWQAHCAAYTAGNMTDYPKKLPKKKLPTRYGAVFYLTDGEALLLARRPDKGLLGAMMELPGTPWLVVAPDAADWLSLAPAKLNWEEAGIVEHVFTHFRLFLTVYRAQSELPEGIHAPLHDLKDFALPSVMVKAAMVGKA
ncbi:A/G-specific adenine glycosylase [Robiginitomaculum antarcticum]|uniref:A/G-specific adenine glycosylase n=1 Tax=Robiginitomaculum antarcticum TaxID=437507 RepID=UPI00036556C4|nr:A/G-specific adenine glycosylase [Robiginitomaculum antarcticum]